MATYKQREIFQGYLNGEIAGEILDAAITFIWEHLAPSDIFTDEQLSDWAEENGYTKEQ